MITAGEAAVDDPIDRLLSAIGAGGPVPAGLFSDDAVLDATVPNWRFTRHGERAVREELSGWYRDPGRFEAVLRTPLPGGELVEFNLTWEEGGMPHAAHQIHVLRLAGNRIVGDTVFCGGRWPASLLAEMAAAELASSRPS
jgi:hypothetical protein